MLKSSILPVVIAASSLFVSGPVLAWDIIGSKVVTDRIDHDVIHAKGPRRFKQIKICVFRNPVHFYDVDVHFANNGHQDIKVAKRINPGHCTRVIDLKGPKRNIRTISFLYEETSMKLRRATVRVLGR